MFRRRRLQRRAAQTLKSDVDGVEASARNAINFQHAGIKCCPLIFYRLMSPPSCVVAVARGRHRRHLFVGATRPVQSSSSKLQQLGKVAPHLTAIPKQTELINSFLFFFFFCCYIAFMYNLLTIDFILNRLQS